jgi:hypothetical protein
MSSWSPQLKGETFELVLETKIASLKNVTCISDVTLYSPHLGKLTQIDLLVLTPWRMYCIEAKSYTTSLSGKIEEDRWVGISKERTTALFNPIIQNFEHVRALKYSLLRNGVYVYDIPSVVIVPDVCDISKSAMKYEIVKTLTGFADDLVTDSIVMAHKADNKILLDCIYKIKSFAGGINNG